MPSGSFSSCSTWRQGADLVEVGGLRVVGVGRLLRDEQDALVAVHRLLQRMHGFLAADEQRNDHVREYHHIAQRQYRQVRTESARLVLSCHGGSR